jgi:hypothetical protein
MSIEKQQQNQQQEITLFEVANDGYVDFSLNDVDSLNRKTPGKDRKVGVDNLVRDYLLSRGYKQAADTLDMERYQKRFESNYFMNFAFNIILYCSFSSAS